MYINPFVAGISVTLFVEAVIFFVYCIYVSYQNNR
jgi:hypothetical protein